MLLNPTRLTPIVGTIVRGTQTASGHSAFTDCGGTLGLQIPIFRSLGLDLGWAYRGTLNVDISPLELEIICPDFHLIDVVWLRELPAETFHFLFVTVHTETVSAYGVIYRPIKRTKIGIYPGDHILELITIDLPVTIGSTIRVNVPRSAVQIHARSQ
jgi:hypothetical protein